MFLFLNIQKYFPALFWHTSTVTFWYSSFHFYLSLTGKDEISTLLITFVLMLLFKKFQLTTLLITIYINFRKYRETISAQVSFSVHMGVARGKHLPFLSRKIGLKGDNFLIKFLIVYIIWEKRIPCSSCYIFSSAFREFFFLKLVLMTVARWGAFAFLMWRKSVLKGALPPPLFLIKFLEIYFTLFEKKSPAEHFYPFF